MINPEDDRILVAAPLMGWGLVAPPIVPSQTPWRDGLWQVSDQTSRRIISAI